MANQQYHIMWISKPDNHWERTGLDPKWKDNTCRTELQAMNQESYIANAVFMFALVSGVLWSGRFFLVGRETRRAAVGEPLCTATCDPFLLLRSFVCLTHKLEENPLFCSNCRSVKLRYPWYCLTAVKLQCKIDCNSVNQANSCGFSDPLNEPVWYIILSVAVCILCWMRIGWRVSDMRYRARKFTGILNPIANTVAS